MKQTKPELSVASIYGTPLTPAWYKPSTERAEIDVSAPLSVAEAANALGIGLTTCKKLVASGELQSYVVRRRRLVARTAVENFKARRGGIERKRRK